jgi:hypothetical protein
MNALGRVSYSLDFSEMEMGKTKKKKEREKKKKRGEIEFVLKILIPTGPIGCRVQSW